VIRTGMRSREPTTSGRSSACWSFRGVATSLFGVALVFGFVACTGSEQSTQDGSDSDDAAAVDSRVQAVPTEFDWSAHGVDSLGRFVGATPVGEGLVVADGLRQRLWWFAANGDLVDAVGREGLGPAEFQALLEVGRRGDLIWTWDLGLNRLQWWATTEDSLRFVESEVLPTRNEVLGVLEGGRIEKRDPSSCTILGSEPFPECEWVLASARDERLIAVSRTGFGSIINLGDRETLAFQPFPTSPVITVAPGGARFAVLRRSALANAITTDTAVVQYDGFGRVLNAQILESPPRPLLDEDVMSEIDWAKDGFSSRILRLENLEERIVKAIDRPSHVPTYVDILMTEAGEVWLREHVLTGGEVNTWAMISENGSAVFRVGLDPDLDVIAFTRTAVWTRERSSLGLTLLQKFDLVFPEDR